MFVKRVMHLLIGILISLALIANYACNKNSTSNISTTTPTYSCDYSVVSKGTRLFGLDILDLPTNGSYADNYNTLKAMHANFQTLPLTWTSIETTAGSGSTSGNLIDPYGALATFSGLAQTDGIKLALTIRPVDATGKTVPSDLSSTRFNNANMITRFEKVIDFVLTKIDKTQLTSIMIGNEVDNYNPSSDTNFWSDYAAFLFAIKTYVNTSYPGLKIGFTSTAAGFISASKTTPDGWNSRSVLQAWAGNVDVVGITYYPLNSDYTMQSPTVVSADFLNLVNAIPSGKRIHIQEIGYSTSATNNSSEYAQSQFFCEVFKAWDDNSHIAQISIVRMNDITRASAEAMAIPYGITSEPFIEYLRTLGHRSSSSNEKSSMTIIRSELTKRSF